MKDTRPSSAWSSSSFLRLSPKVGCVLPVKCDCRGSMEEGHTVTHRTQSSLKWWPLWRHRWLFAPCPSFEMITGCFWWPTLVGRMNAATVRKLKLNANERGSSFSHHVLSKTDLHTLWWHPSPWQTKLCSVVSILQTAWHQTQLHGHVHEGPELALLPQEARSFSHTQQDAPDVSSVCCSGAVILAATCWRADFKAKDTDRLNELMKKAGCCWDQLVTMEESAVVQQQQLQYLIISTASGSYAGGCRSLPSSGLLLEYTLYRSNSALYCGLISPSHTRIRTMLMQYPPPPFIINK